MQDVFIVMCDFECRPNKKLDFKSLKDELGKDSPEIVLLKKPCQEEFINPDRLKGKKVLFAGCPLLEKSGFYTDTASRLSLKTGDYTVLDIKSTVFDLYETPSGVKNNLIRQLKSSIGLLGAKESLEAEKIKPDHKVLVYGSGFSGLSAAQQLSRTDIPVDILETPDPKVSPGCLCELLSGGGPVDRLREEAAGNENIVFFPLAGSYQITPVIDGYQLKMKDSPETLYGAIVFAPERIEKPGMEEGSLNLTGLYTKMENGEKLAGVTVFLLDLNKASSAEIVLDVLAAARYLRRTFSGDVWVLLKNVQVSNQYQEELYRECREAGVVFVKYRDDISIKNDYSDFLIQGFDTQLNEKFAIQSPDRLVIPGTPVLSGEAMVFAAKLQLRLVEAEYSQPDSQWCLPNETNRTGVYAAGSARGNMTAGLIEEDISSLVSSVRYRFNPDGVPVKEHIPVVDTTKCVYCLTCIRVCPYSAMEKDTEERVARVVSSACEGCGICIAECPAEALEVRNLEREPLFNGIKVLAGGE